ncbi:MAG: LssY C-terminal domain-containing protein [Phreatobacter sp.]
MTTARRLFRIKVWATALVFLLVLYAALAYLALPEVWSHYEHQPGLAGRPMLTTTTTGIPGDPINVGLVGSRAELVQALITAGWKPADAITLRSSLGIGFSVLFARPYPQAPVSTLKFEGRPQDLAFEKPEGGSADRRHHVRFWQALDRGTEGRPVWLGAASFDRGVGFSHFTGQITHHIAPDVDAERDLVIADLTAAGMLDATYQVSGIGPTLAGINGGGDRYFTDGEVTIGVLSVNAAKMAEVPRELANPPVVAAKQGAWQAVVRLFRWFSGGR